jgi:hypothetical protein
MTKTQHRRLSTIVEDGLDDTFRRFDREIRQGRATAEEIEEVLKGYDLDDSWNEWNLAESVTASD